MDEFDAQVASIHRRELKRKILKEGAILVLIVVVIIVLFKCGG